MNAFKAQNTFALESSYYRNMTVKYKSLAKTDSILFYCSIYFLRNLKTYMYITTYSRVYGRGV